MGKNLLSIEPEDPLAKTILGDFLTFMEGFVSLPIYIPGAGNAYSRAIRVITSNLVFHFIIHKNIFRSELISHMAIYSRKSRTIRIFYLYLY